MGRSTTPSCTRASAITKTSRSGSTVTPVSSSLKRREPDKSPKSTKKSNLSPVKTSTPIRSLKKPQVKKGQRKTNFEQTPFQKVFRLQYFLKIGLKIDIFCEWMSRESSVD